MTAYVPSMPSDKGSSGRKAILICPGGAFVGHTEREMEEVALQFLAEGYCAFVLNYSIGAGLALLPAPIVDIGKALVSIKARERRYGIDPEEVTVLGFSSGAYLVGLYASVWHEKWLSQELRMPSETIKPKGVILSYPILDLKDFANQINARLPEQAVVVEMMFSALWNTPFPTDEQFMRWSTAKHLSDKTLPTWIWAWSEDAFVDREQLSLYQKKVLDHDGECQLTLFSGDVHGSGLRFGGDRMNRGMWFEKLTQWTNQCQSKSLPK